MKKVLIALLFALLGSFQNVAAADDEITSQDLCNLSHSEYSNLNNEKLLDMKYEEYALALTCVKAREDAAKAEIATLEGEIAGLKTQVDEAKAAIVSKWNEMLAFVGITQAEYDAFVASIDGFIPKLEVSKANLLKISKLGLLL
jgi:hypothetical protein